MKTVFDIGICLLAVVMMLTVGMELRRLEYAVFAPIYFLTEVPPLLGLLVVYRWGSSGAAETVQVAQTS
jgi:hypothetical protein